MMPMNKQAAVILLSVGLGFSGIAVAGHVDVDSMPESKRTVQEFYLSAKEAYELKSNDPSVMFIDVRSQRELIESGSPTLRDANIPYLSNSQPETTGGTGTIAWAELNPDFLRSVHALRAARGATTDTPVIVICRAGRVSAKAADLLALAGFKRVYVVVNGFEGKPATETAGAENTLEPGWKPAGLPWAYLSKRESGAS